MLEIEVEQVDTLKLFNTITIDGSDIPYCIMRIDGHTLLIKPVHTSESLH